MVLTDNIDAPRFPLNSACVSYSGFSRRVKHFSGLYVSNFYQTERQSTALSPWAVQSLSNSVNQTNSFAAITFLKPLVDERKNFQLMFFATSLQFANIRKHNINIVK